MFDCFKCGGETRVTKAVCRRCGLGYEGEFETPRLARLGAADRALVEALIMSAGNLSRVSETMNVSYPTLRKRMDALIDRLSDLRRSDAERMEGMLTAVEKGEMDPEAAARLIEEMGGDA